LGGIPLEFITSKLTRPVQTTPTVARYCDKMSDGEDLVMDADAPDESSEGSGNPDQDWDGGDDDDDDDASKGVLQVDGSIKPSSAKFFGQHKEYMQCLTQIIGLVTTQGVDVLESQGIDFEALKLLTDSNIKSSYNNVATATSCRGLACSHFLTVRQPMIGMSSNKQQICGF
jgi:hypothetical protein